MLELRSITKRFPGVTALANVSLAFAPGEIHGLMGENGAGKSTLIKIITGIYQPDEGEICFEGQSLRFRSYRDSLEKGIDIVNQEIQVIPASSIAENIMLDKMITRGRTGIIDWPAVNEKASFYTRMVGLDLPVTAAIRDLSAAHKQLAQIAKALAADARVLLLDEPTSCLTAHEAENLFVILRRLKAQGRILIFVSHKFEEVFSLCDKASVLRDGRYVGTRAVAGLTQQELTRMMIGRETSSAHVGRLDADKSAEALRVSKLTRGGKAQDISFTLRFGEILGCYGLVGAGRTEVARLLIGEDQPDSGSILVRGKPARIRNVRDSLYQYRIGYVSENRKEEGLLLQSPISTNITITIWPRLINRFTRSISRRKELQTTHQMIAALNIRAAGVHQPVDQLSGGNQQKVCISKWLAADCDILIIDEPTVGVDIGAKEQIHRQIWNLAKMQRKAVLLISSDMPEIIRLASRILVFREHRIVHEIDRVDDPARDYGQISTEIGRYLH